MEHTPQNYCLFFNLVRLGVHFPKTFSSENIYENLSNIDMGARMRGRELG